MLARFAQDHGHTETAFFRTPVSTLRATNIESGGEGVNVPTWESYAGGLVFRTRRNKTNDVGELRRRTFVAHASMINTGKIDT